MQKRLTQTAMLFLVVTLSGCKKSYRNDHHATDEFAAASQELKDSQTFSRIKEGAEQGNAMQQYQMGYDYEKGEDVYQDYKQAALWYQKSADQGFAAAQWSLGNLYFNNMGLPRDYEKAYFWLSLAATGFSQSASKQKDQVDQENLAKIASHRDAAAQHFTTPELLEIQEQTQQFLANHPKSY